MAFINWNDSLDLGIDEIDAQHRELVALVNALHEAAGNSATPGELKDLVSRVAGDIARHFETEERIFRVYGYPEAERHAAIHRSLIAQIGDLKARMSDGNLTVTETVLEFLRDWFLTHTTGSDLVYAVWMKNNGFIDPKTKKLISAP